MRPTLRTFIAVDIASGIRSGIQKATKPMRNVFPEIRWVDDFSFHLTLKFLGDVPINELHSLNKGVERACQQVEQFDLTFEGLGAFPNLESPRSLWVGVTGGVEEICQLSAALDTELATLGYPREGRLFTPHMTIGRIKQAMPLEKTVTKLLLPKEGRKRLSKIGREPPEQEFPQEVHYSLLEMIEEEKTRIFGCSSVDEVVIYSSELSREGPRYEVLATIDLPATLG